jgi:nitrogen fixation/metabolism regulation signal transduction histidine kinase
VSARYKFIAYLIFIHLIFAASTAALLWNQRVWLLGIEAFLLISFFIAYRFLHALIEPLKFLLTGAEFIKESDFTSEFREIGQTEMDELIRVYNKMVASLREERLRQQEQHHFLDKLITASPSGIITLDFDDKIAMVNPSAEKIMQTSAKQLAGKKFSELQTPFGDALHQLPVGGSQVIPLRRQRRLKCHKSQFLESGFARTFILMEELTEELRRSEKSAYEKLIRMMSHEVNNSIGAVNSLLHSCLNYKSQLRDEDRKDFENALLVSILRTDHLSAFMKSFADVVRLPAPVLAPCDLKKLLEGIAALMKPESQKRNISWQWDIQEPLRTVMMDKNQMEQVFVNVIKNAMEAIGNDGTITIIMGKKENRGFVIIEDTGSGIAPEVRANLFTPFFTTKENGQGLGLTMVQEILSRHQFEFSLDGEPGRPTQFVIYF